jgi:CDP-diacylglycerol--glycerol-3-phosphate 3-phosphatidyltransferase
LKEKTRKLFSNVWTIPNILTMLRLVLIPVFVWFFCLAHPCGACCVRKDWLMASLAVFVVASLTDMLDGYLARKLNQITDFGKLFDPLADKLMVLTAMVCQAVAGVFPWAAIIIVAAKELYMVLGGMFMLKRGVVVYSNIYGKAAQVCFIASLVLSFFHEDFLAGGTKLFGLTPDILLLWITVALAIVAMVIYTVNAFKQIRHPSADH